jgi:hypothetical protein
LEHPIRPEANAAQLTIMKMHVLLSVTLILAASPARAATLTPAVPTAQDVIIATIPVGGATSFSASSTSISGNLIRTNLTIVGFDGGPPVGPSTQIATFGPLPTGTYTYQVYTIYQGQATLLSQQTIIIAPAIPAINGLGLAILVMCLTWLGFFTLAK